MKLFRLFAATVIAGLFFSSSAHAITINNNQPIVPGMHGDGLPGHPYLVNKSDTGISFGDYVVSGVLSAGTQISITFTATDVILGALVSGSATAMAPKKVSLPNLTLPTLATATKWSGGILTDTILISNADALDRNENFKAYFLDAVAACGGRLKISYFASALPPSGVPLPPAFVLFSSGLMVLAGFAARKKAAA